MSEEKEPVTLRHLIALEEIIDLRKNGLASSLIGILLVISMSLLIAFLPFDGLLCIVVISMGLLSTVFFGLGRSFGLKAEEKLESLKNEIR
jgi:hypothetical protein